MDLPQLLYIGPAIEPSLGGSALIYKLLQNYPRERLVSVELHLTRLKSPEKANACCAIRVINPWPGAGPRAHTLFELSLLYGRQAWATWLNWKLRKYRFEAVICVTHTWLCELGLKLARKRNVAFHAIIHDHAKHTLPVPKQLSHYRQKRWERLCRQADACLCVSPYMAEEVVRVGGRACSVLYPGLGPQAELRAWEPPIKPGRSASLTFAFIGTLHAGYREMILNFGRVLESAGHRMVLHAPGAAELARIPSSGLVDGGWISTDAVASTLRRNADVLFLPMSFQKEDEPNMRVSFPSKMVEYCAAGRPILIWGPPYCSAVRWAKEHSGFAEVLETTSETALCAALQRLSDPSRREQMGRESLRLAREFFSHEKTFGHFLKVLVQPNLHTRTK